MKSVVGLENFSIFQLLVILMATFAIADSATKNRRAGNTGLYAFPRVGRSDPSLANSLHEAREAAALETLYGNVDDSQEDYAEYPKSDIKRASLIAFPRVGRNDADLRNWAHLMALQQALEKRTGPSASSGLWFGPRLGKRSVDAHEYQATTAAAATGQKEFY